MTTVWELVLTVSLLWLAYAYLGYPPFSSFSPAARLAG